MNILVLHKAQELDEMKQELILRTDMSVDEKLKQPCHDKLHFAEI
jgi:hypothetical protein